MTQHDLAQAAGVPQPSIVRIERGTVSPRAETLVTLLRATGHRLLVDPIGPPVAADATPARLAMNVPRRVRTALGGTTPLRILRRLRRFNVPFVLIGDLAEAAHGSPGEASGLVKVCVASTDVARERLQQALDDLGSLAGPGRLQAVTRTPAGDDYEVLVRNAVKLHADAGLVVPVASLQDLIRDRKATSAPKDLQVAAMLESIVDQSSE